MSRQNSHALMVCIVASSLWFAAPAAAQQDVSAWARTQTDSTAILMIDHCSELGCGSRSRGPLLDRDVAATELAVAPGARITVHIRPGPDSLAMTSRLADIIDRAMATIEPEPLGEDAWSIDAPTVPGVYHVFVEARWLGEAQAAAGLRSAYWQFQVRVREAGANRPGAM